MRKISGETDFSGVGYLLAGRKVRVEAAEKGKWNKSNVNSGTGADLGENIEKIITQRFHKDGTAFQ